LINYLGQDRDLKAIANLDGIHKVAKASQIVTPYSSMIVLVNDQQRNDLKQAEKQSDRFKREIEDKQLAPANDLPLPVSAVPEPAEWMLILVVAIALGMIVKRQKENAIV
jgi:putative PEP-CTERM system integral membrane protein